MSLKNICDILAQILLSQHLRRCLLVFCVKPQFCLEGTLWKSILWIAHKTRDCICVAWLSFVNFLILLELLVDTFLHNAHYGFFQQIALICDLWLYRWVLHASEDVKVRWLAFFLRCLAKGIIILRFLAGCLIAVCKLLSRKASISMMLNFLRVVTDMGRKDRWIVNRGHKRGCMRVMMLTLGLIC